MGRSLPDGPTRRVRRGPVGDRVPEGWARDIGAALSGRFGDLCRGVEIGQAQPADYRGSATRRTGIGCSCTTTVCRSWAWTRCAVRGPPQGCSSRPRFNGDVEKCLNAWRTVSADPRRVARKTLLAAAGLISVHYGTWTTDRGTAARRWAELDPDCAVAVARILSWAEGRSIPSAATLGAALGRSGVVAVVAERFHTDVGL